MELFNRYFNETVGSNGQLESIDIDYPEDFNFAYDVVDVLGEKCPDKRALVWCNTDGEEREFTFAHIKRESNKAANALLDAGVKKGDKVMVVLKRHYEYWFVAIALHKIGAVMIPVTHMLTVKDFVYRMECAKVKAVICTTLNGVPDKVKQAKDELGIDCLLYTVKGSVEGFANFGDAMEKASDALNRIESKASDPMVLYFTSGTSGNPKGVIHDYTYPLAHYVTAKYWQCVKEDGLHLTVSETGWAKASWGKLYGQWLCGCAVMVYDFDNFEPKQLNGIINKYGVTSFCAPPTIYRYLTRKNAATMPSVEQAVTAGEFLSPEVFDGFKECTGLTLREGYGQTETTLLIANLFGNESRNGSLGKPSPLYSIRLLDREGNEVPQGEIGEVCIVPKKGKRPVGVFCNYLDNDEKYQNAWRGGVYHTGDAVWQDEDGYFWFHGRFDDIIKSGGFRIGPYEVEEVLAKHPAVAECSVIGVPDALRGQAIKAVVVLSDGYTPSKELDKEIREFTNGILAEYKWIRLLEFVDAMPKTISGKIRKAKLREMM